MTGAAIQRRVVGHGLTVSAVHPGIVSSTLITFHPDSGKQTLYMYILCMYFIVFMMYAVYTARTIT